MYDELTEEQPVAELTVEECWELLAAEEFGRLAYHLVDEVHLVPVNYAVDAGSILIRTAPGNKLLASELGADVAFEIDWYGDDAAWSVLVRGRIRHLEEREMHRLAAIPLRPWVPTLKYHGIELVPNVITGRRFFIVRG